MGRPIRQRTCHWSDDHRWFLVAMARRVLRKCGVPKSDGQFDVDELVNVGWLGCLRHCPPDRLDRTAKNVKRTMTEHIQKMRTGKSAWLRQRTAETAFVPIAEVVERGLTDEFDGFAAVENEDWLAWVLAGLPDRHQTVVRRCVINEEEQAMVGKDLHIGGSRVGQLRDEALRAIRHRVA